MNLADLGVTPEFLDKSAHPKEGDFEKERAKIEATRKRLAGHLPYFIKCCREHGPGIAPPEVEANLMFGILCVIDMAIEEATASANGSNPPA